MHPNSSYTLFLQVFCIYGSLSILLVYGCSTMTHIEIGERASKYFVAISGGVDYHQLILKHPDAFQAGAPYPDAFYPGICFGGDYHDIAEDSHWTPFIKATVDYIQRKYTKPWSEDAEKLIVFLLGVVQHQVSDATWHSLGIEQGFLDTMGKINYHGSFSKAHSDGDFGGDVLNMYQLNMNYVGQIAKWYVPVSDLMEIYTDMYGTENPMTPHIIESCTQLLFLGRLGESIGAIDLLYPLYAGRSPFLLDRLQDYYLGGMDDMAVWTQNTWIRTLYMLQFSTNNCTLPDNPIYIRCDNEPQKSTHNEIEQNLECDTRAKSVERWFTAVSPFADSNSIVVEHSNKGVLYSASDSAMRQIKRRLIKSGREITPCHSEEVIPPPHLYLTNEAYARLGQFMTSGDINNDGHTDVIISSPSFSVAGNYQRGRVYIIYGSESGVPSQSLLVERDANQILDGVDANGRFGSSAVLVDMNADGLIDMVVSAPSVGSQSLDYYGRVYIYLSTAPNQPLPARPSITIRCTERYCNLGTSLSAGDVNGDGLHDLIVGSPYAGAGGKQRGMVGVIYSSVSLTAGQSLTEADFDWRFEGSQDYEWVGYSVTCGPGAGGGRALAVGAPSYRLCARPGCSYDDTDTQAVGRLYLFSSPSPSTPLPTQPSLTLEGSQQFQQLGGFVSITKYYGLHVLILTSLSADVAEGDTVTGRGWIQAGRVEFYLLNTSQPSSLAQPIITLHGTRDYGRFGSQVLILNPDSDSFILVTSPFRSEDFFEDREGGRVYLYAAESLTENKANQTFGILSSKSRFGSSMTLIKNSDSTTQLLIGGENYNRINGPLVNRLLGVVGLYQL